MKLHIKIIISLMLISSVNLMAENVYTHKNIDLKNGIAFIKNTNEKVNGIVKSYYKSGALDYEYTFKDGKENGILKIYYESGALLSEINFKVGKAISGIYYHKDGSIDRKMTNADFHKLGYEY